MIAKCLKRYELFEALYINLSNWVLGKRYVMIHCIGIIKILCKNKRAVHICGVSLGGILSVCRD